MSAYFVLRNHKTGTSHLRDGGFLNTECGLYVEPCHRENLGRLEHIGDSFVSCRTCRRIMETRGITEQGSHPESQHSVTKKLLLHLDKKVKDASEQHKSEFNIVRQLCMHRKFHSGDGLFSCNKIKTPSYHECRFKNCPYLKDSRPNRPFVNPTTVGGE